MDLATAATALYVARKGRITHPEGSFDNAARFIPSPREDADDYTCSVRTPSRRYPNSYNNAARSRRHIASLAARVPDFVLEQAKMVAGRVAFDHKSVASTKRLIDKAAAEIEDARLASIANKARMEHELRSRQEAEDAARSAAMTDSGIAEDGEVLARIAA